MADAAPGALEGLRVVEWGDFISAPYAGKLLADLGADVIKVETPAGDASRRHGPFVDDQPHAEKSGLYLFLNTNKRAVTLDVTTPAGRDLFGELVGWADVLIHNRRPQELAELGCTYEELSAGHPSLVMGSITVFGYGTPYQDWEATALQATMGSGLARHIGDPDRAPLWLPYCAADFQGGVHGAIATMLALRARKASGEGQHAWVSIVEILSTVMGGGGLSQYVYRGQIRSRNGVHMNSFYPWQVTPVRDGYFEVITMVDSQWNRFVEMMGNPPWRDDERLRNRWLAYQWADELDEYWHPWMRERTKAELWAQFREQRIPFQPVHSVDDVAGAEQLATRDFFQTVEHPEAGRVRLPGAPYRLSASPWALRRPPPLLGQHNDQVFAELLGHDAPELAELHQAGVI